MMKLPLVCAAASVMAGCAPGASIEPAVASAGTTCISTDRIISRRPAGANAVLFELTGGRTYRNELPAACPGLDRASKIDVIVLESTGTQLCRGDSFRLVDPVQTRAGGLAGFTRCRLGAFVPVARAQAR